MLCQDCKKREAQVHLTQIINNEKTSLSLCKECAAVRGFHSPLENMPFPLAEILSSMAAVSPGSPGTEREETLECPGCGLSFDEFTHQGRFGCGDCYKAFRHRLEPIMRKIHGASLHRGRIPIPATSESSDIMPVPVREEERLDDELKKAIESEDFERAAELRDKLKALKETMAVENE
jgi:protein arginine kinase activator